MKHLYIRLRSLLDLFGAITLLPTRSGYTSILPPRHNSNLTIKTTITGIFFSNSHSTCQKLASANRKNLAPGKMIGIEKEGKSILIANVNGMYYAIGNICTHMGCALTRLLANQDDIGNVIKPFYGNAAGDQLTALLKAHNQILMTADFISDGILSQFPQKFTEGFVK